MADYKNLSSEVWMLQHEEKTYRIVPGLNKNLPENIFHEKLENLNPQKEKEVVIQIEKPSIESQVEKEKILYERFRNDILLDDTLIDAQKNLCLKILKQNLENKLKQIKGEENEKF